MRKLPEPFLKWAGGKRRLAPEILKRFPREPGALKSFSFRRYHEPFLGGGAVFFAMVREDPLVADRPSFLSDLNGELVDCYCTVRDDCERLIRDLAKMATATTRSEYEAIRELDPGKLSRVERAARTLYLNRLCFNGLYRLNRDGKFNVPYGRSQNPRVVDPDNLRACSHALQHATIRTSGFRQSLEKVELGDLVYLDPPYLTLPGAQSFTGFTSERFGPLEHEALAQEFAMVANVGARAVLSNSDVGEAWRLYGRWKIERVRDRRSIAASGGKRGPAGEILVTSHGGR